MSRWRVAGQVCSRALASSTLCALLVSPLWAGECPDILLAPESGDDQIVIWVSEAAILGTGSDCASEQLIAAMRRGLCPRTECSRDLEFGRVVSMPGMEGIQDLRPFTIEGAVERSEFVVVATIDEIQTGIASGHVWKRIRARLTESLKTAGWSGENGTHVTFLQPGGAFTVNGGIVCTEVPPGARAWSVGETVLLAGWDTDMSDRSVLWVIERAFLVRGDDVFPPGSENWSTEHASLDLLREVARDSRRGSPRMGTE